jgi:hypothetical protein
MLERWDLAELWMVPMYAIPYILFYIGIICYYRSANHLEVFTAARYKNYRIMTFFNYDSFEGLF